MFKIHPAAPDAPKFGAHWDSGGGGGSTNTVSKADPWAGQQPYLQNVFGRAEDLYQNNPLQYFQGQTYAGLSPETETSLQMQTDRALNGSQLNNAAQANLTDTLNGKYLDVNQNPYLMPAADSIMAKVLPQINSQFAGAGRGNSGLAARAAGEGATNAIGGLALQNYNNERTNQQRSALLSPQLAQQDYADAARLGEVGSVREDLAQQGINDQMQRFQFENMAPWQQLGLYNQLIQGNYGGQTTEAQTAPRRSIGAGVLTGAVGGGALGALAGNNLGFSPTYGAAGGAAMGGLMGLL
jgi:hypothetical protein